MEWPLRVWPVGQDCGSHVTVACFPVEAGGTVGARDGAVGGTGAVKKVTVIWVPTGTGPDGLMPETVSVFDGSSAGVLAVGVGAVVVGVTVGVGAGVTIRVGVGVDRELFARLLNIVMSATTRTTTKMTASVTSGHVHGLRFCGSGLTSSWVG